jgi:hypothetical protein
VIASDRCRFPALRDPLSVSHFLIFIRNWQRIA